MQPAQPPARLTEQAYNAILDDICDGTLPAGTHLVQEQLAAALGISRQPVQQALALLKADGMVAEVGRRGLAVTPLDMTLVRHHYEIRAALDGVAAGAAARQCRAGAAPGFVAAAEAILRAGAAAIAADAVAAQLRHDAALHALIYATSGNPLIARAAAPHWRFLRRAMGEVLRQAEPPRVIWDQHAEMVAAIAAGPPERAEALAVAHAAHAANALAAAVAEIPPGRDRPSRAA